MTWLEGWRCPLIHPKIKFQIMSDLHLEVGQQYATFNIPAHAPFLILAGDIGRLIDYTAYLEFLRRQCLIFQKVFLVLGNHEFFGTSRANGLRLAGSLENEHELGGKLHVLDRIRVDLPDSNVTVLGCTLHSKIALEAEEVVAKKIKDFQRIEDWGVQDHNREHAKDVQWLRDQIENTHRAKDHTKRKLIVVTHHAPICHGTSRPKDSENPWSSAFATNLLPEPVFSNVQWWIFGHTHFTTKFRKGQIRLISNQRGYVIPGHESPVRKTPLRESLRQRDDQFDARKVIQV